MATKKSDELTPAEQRSFRKELLEQLVTLSTAGFGLVAALAWNEAIKSFVEQYIQPYFPNTAIYYKFFYALLITIIAVVITYQLSQIRAKFENRGK